MPSYSSCHTEALLSKSFIWPWPLSQRAHTGKGANITTTATGIPTVGNSTLILPHEQNQCRKENSQNGHVVQKPGTLVQVSLMGMHYVNHSRIGHFIGKYEHSANELLCVSYKVFGLMKRGEEGRTRIMMSFHFFPLLLPREQKIWATSCTDHIPPHVRTHIHTPFPHP